MAKTATRNVIAKPKKKVRATRARVKNTEPGWEGSLEWDGPTFHKARRAACDHYYANSKVADLLPSLYKWMKDNEYSARDIKSAKAAPNTLIGIVPCYMARMLQNGMPDYHAAHDEYWQSLPGTSGEVKPVSEFLHSRIKDIIRVGEPLVAEKEAEERAAAKASAVTGRTPPTIQDRLNEKVNEILGELEGRYDTIILGGSDAPDAYKLFQDENLPQAKISSVIEHYKSYLAALKEDQKLAKAGDEDCKEAYAHMKAADWKRHFAWYDAVIADLEAYAQLKKTTRKARIKKSPSKEKVVAKLKYAKDNAELKLVSINPVDIVGAQELWVYNAKTRKLGKYIADSMQGPLSVKGTTIVGYDEFKSVQKTLRKPAEQLKAFTSAGKIQLRKFMDTVKTTETKLNGRINAETLLLKVA